MQSKTTDYIKNKNRKWLIAYLTLHFILFGIFSGFINLSFNDISNFFSKLNNPGNLFSLILIPLTIVLEGLIPSHLKARIVFLRFKNALPGHRAFSVIAPKDSRLDMACLNGMFPAGLPDKPKEQNNHWYSVYSQVKNSTIVVNAHRAYLLTRDLAALTAILIPTCAIAHLLWNTQNQKITHHLVILIVLFILNIISAQNYGKRFVANVLVKATSNFKERGYL